MVVKIKRVKSAEILAVDNALKAMDSKFTFFLRWGIYDHKRYIVPIKGQSTAWKAGSIEELLAAIQAAELALENLGLTRSYDRELRQTVFGQLYPKCKVCGQQRKLLAPEHTPERCAKALEAFKATCVVAGRVRSRKKLLEVRKTLAIVNARRWKKLSQTPLAIAKRASRARMKAAEKKVR